ncbi:hypothetical protein [Xenorhabdus bharatensis]|uniref:hypothetical protein n=1 Tax=Xenorhabdus bharatensis TaxID=3136256 RepID=UPI0030F3D92E
MPTEQYKTGEVNPNPTENIHRVTYRITEKGFRMLDMKNGIDAERFYDGEAGAPNKVLYKRNEAGVRGIGVNVLKEFNEEIVSTEYQTRVGKKYGKSKPITVCKGKKGG